MLVRNPISFSDAPKLTLEIQKTKFSVVRYYQECISTISNRRNEYLSEAIQENNIAFPNSLCMHALVITQDDRILITKRSSKVDYSKNTWSVSIEEQLSADDLRPGTTGTVKRWAQRCLLEELGVNEMDYDYRNLLLLSVFLEVDIMNCAVVAALRLNLTSQELDAIIKSFPRADYEFTEWRFLTYQELAEELKTLTLLHHPSSGYRILLALINRFGAELALDMLFPIFKRV